MLHLHWSLFLLSICVEYWPIISAHVFSVNMLGRYVRFHPFGCIRETMKHRKATCASLFNIGSHSHACSMRIENMHSAISRQVCSTALRLNMLPPDSKENTLYFPILTHNAFSGGWTKVLARGSSCALRGMGTFFLTADTKCTEWGKAFFLHSHHMNEKKNPLSCRC